MADEDDVKVSDEFDALLRQELSIEPSLAFVARVRQCAREQDPPGWRARRAPALGSLAAVASLAVAVTVPASHRWTSPPLAPAPPALAAAFVQHPSVDEGSMAVTPSRSRAKNLGPAPPRRPRVFPEVLVDRRQRAALTTWLRMVEQGRLSGDSFAATVPISLEPIADLLGDITVAPVTVSALPPGGVLPEDER